MKTNFSRWEMAQSTILESVDENLTALENITKCLISPKTGLISSIQQVRNHVNYLPVWIYSAHCSNFSVYDRGASLPKGFASYGVSGGIGLTQEEAMLAAIGEAVERYAACTYVPELDVTTTSYTEIKNTAIHPTLFALASEQEKRKFNIRDFDDNQRFGWVRGFSYPNKKQIFVPAPFVYADYQLRFPEQFLAPDISTGLAVGPTLEWAILRGLWECIERDAVMITYLNCLPVPEIDLNSLDDPKITDLLHRIPPWSNIEIRAWCVTLDIQVPVILAAILGKSADLPAIAFGSAARNDPNQAILKAILEALHCWVGVESSIYPKYRLRSFQPDYSDVTSRSDHIGLGSQRAYLQKIRWLLDGKHRLRAETLQASYPSVSPNDLEFALEAVKRVGLETLVLDITQPDIQEAGLYACRVLVPGLQPLAFGPIRLLGGKRLYEVPYKLGFTSTRLNEEQINPVPHPMP